MHRLSDPHEITSSLCLNIQASGIWYYTETQAKMKFRLFNPNTRLHGNICIYVQLKLTAKIEQRQLEPFFLRSIIYIYVKLQVKIPEYTDVPAQICIVFWGFYPYHFVFYGTVNIKQ